jgi:hypothetical protein
VARHDPEVAGHRWLTRATRWCLDTIGGLETAPVAHELMFAVRVLDAAAAVEPDAATLLQRLASFLPADGVVRVAGGTANEVLRPLDLAPRSDGPARGLFDAAVVAADLHRVAAGQQADGGWRVDFASESPAAELEWRGYATVAAVATLRPAG